MGLLDGFLIRATVAGVGVALAAAPLGCFVVWRRMANFGDATVHAAILGVALALVFDGPTLSHRGYAMDILLGVLAHSALAIGLIAVSFLQGVRIDLMAYLFGDILAVGRVDLLVIWGGAGSDPDLAYAAGFDSRREQMVLTLALAIVVAVAIKVVGVLLIGALLIIPAATARPFASTPERMALAAAAIGIVSAARRIADVLLFRHACRSFGCVRGGRLHRNCRHHRSDFAACGALTLRPCTCPRPGRGLSGPKA